MRRSEATWARWRALVEEQAASGLPATRFCRERGIPISTMFVWKRKLRAAGGGAEGETVAGGSAAGGPAFLEAIVRHGGETRARADAAAASGVTIELSCGRRVLVSPGFDRGLLLDVLGVLESHGRREIGA